MPQFPDQMRRFHSTRGLLVAEPEEHSLRVCCGGCRRVVWFAGSFHEEVAVKRERRGEVMFVVVSAVVRRVGGGNGAGWVGNEVHDIVASHVSWFHEGGLDVKAVHLV